MSTPASAQDPAAGGGVGKPAAPAPAPVAVPPAAADRPVGSARFAPLAVWGLLAGAVGYVLSHNPADHEPELLGGCGWYTLFGTNGPTCGGTRMVWYLAHGDLVNAARMHLIALIGTPFALYMLVQWTGSRLFGVRLPPLRLRWWVWVGYAVAFVIYGAVLRNLPGFEWFHLDYMQPGVGL
jgi:Protein of unknown function (DUF2752)